MANGLGPGLLGYVAAEQAAQQRGQNQIGQLGGLLSLQNAMAEQQMTPLKIEQMRIAVEQAKANMARRTQLMGPSVPQPGQGSGYSPAVSQAFGMPPSQPQAAQTGGGPYGDIPREVMADLVSNDPGLKALAQEALKIQLERQKPVVGREGAPILERGPNGEYRVAFSAPKSEAGIQLNYGAGGIANAVPIPGYNAALTAKTGAEESGKSPYRLREVPVAGGATRLMSEADFLASQRPKPEPQMPPVAPIGNMAPQGNLRGAASDIPPEQPSARDIAAIDAELRNPRLIPSQRGALQSERARLVMANPQLGVGLSPQQSAEQREAGQVLGKQFEAVMGDAGKAAISNRYLDVMEGMAKDFNPGKLAPMQNSLIQWSQALGLPLSNEDKRAAGSIQGLTSMAIKLAGQATRQSDAQPSQLQYFKILESMPNAERTPEGFSRIIGYMRDVNNINIIKAQELQKWKQDRGTADGFEAQWPTMAKDLPFSWNTDKSIADAKTAQGSVRRYNPATGKIE